MKSRFVEWYREVAIEPQHEQLEKRWESIEMYLEDYDDDTILALALNYLGIEQELESNSEFIECLIKTDLSFDKRNGKEIRLLCGIALAELVETEPIVATLAAECLLLFNNNSKAKKLCHFFEERFMQECITLRENMPKLETIDGKSQAEAIAEEFAEGVVLNVSTANASISQILSSFDKYIVKLISANNKFINHLEIYKEESRILSWLIGESSNDLGNAFKTMNQEDAAIIIGKELADLVLVLPGPYAAKAFIKKMLQLTKPKQKKSFTLDIYVDALDLSWRKKVLERYPLINEGMNTPILFAISKSIEVENPKEWLPAFKKKSGIDAGTFTVYSDDAAYQIYLECLLIKLIDR